MHHSSFRCKFVATCANDGSSARTRSFVLAIRRPARHLPLQFPFRSDCLPTILPRAVVAGLRINHSHLFPPRLLFHKHVFFLAGGYIALLEPLQNIPPTRNLHVPRGHPCVCIAKCCQNLVHFPLAFCTPPSSEW